jgi:dCTP deaminase
MLSDRDILRAIKDGELSIEPFNPKQLRPAGISFHLGGEILVPKPTKLIDLKREADIGYETVKITEDEPFIIHPSQFVLGHTAEIVSVGTKLGFIIEGRSTLARLGISIEQSATIVDPGHTDRPVTLEIFNAGPSPVTLYGGMAIARTIVFRLSSESSRSFDAYSRYASQKSGVSKPILRLKSE